MLVAVNELDFWSVLSEKGEIWFQFSVNHEPSMPVPMIAMKGPKVGVMEADLAMLTPNQLIQTERKRRTSDCCSTPPWAVMVQSIIQNPGCWPCRSMIVVPCSPTVHGS